MYMYMYVHVHVCPCKCTCTLYVTLYEWHSIVGEFGSTEREMSKAVH